eukprot:CAMPEP_0175918960 /NCGR_PEP_ID=MMETSP0108-20121206/12150_1 /TAXON_ID=195067 ORGANISM="Goniomonas pacifica, Strain CCMP1869" /NCGR_SAMPLE_ID=MMETSP0108 /ASSEMBLY_ACC=CAM_ASM_000204 /LENGTH=104 /DNA_ID=CAMNT_0017241597 /DNA_START=60 /DNA_END=374 /DNA_ORIENTATION=-
MEQVWAEEEESKLSTEAQIGVGIAAAFVAAALVALTYYLIGLRRLSSRRAKSLSPLNLSYMSNPSLTLSSPVPLFAASLEVSELQEPAPVWEESPTNWMEVEPI